LGAGHVEVLGTTVQVAERVKFGAYRPDAAEAEKDWSRIRDWIAKAPEG
jgi:hypothetical protein